MKTKQDEIAFEHFKEMDAQEAQDFFGACAQHYAHNAEKLDNMNALQISAHLKAVWELLDARTGN